MLLAAPAPPHELLVRIDEVQLHEVHHDRESLIEWGPMELSIGDDSDSAGLDIKVGSTKWVLTSALPTLKAAQGTYMFAIDGERKVFYSVLLAPSTSEENASIFEEILSECTSFELAGGMSKESAETIVQEVADDIAADEEGFLAEGMRPGQDGQLTQDTPSTSDRIMAVGSSVQGAILASANWASQKIMEKSQAYQVKTEPCKKPVNISPEVARRVKLARGVANKGSRAANAVAGGIADISIKVADTIVKRMGPTRYGEQLADPASRTSAAHEVAAAAVVAAVGVYDSMEQAARIVFTSGGEATSQFVGHKYGQAAGDVTKDAAHAAVTTGMTMVSVQKIGVKNVARRIAKRTATGLAKAHFQNYSQQQGARPITDSPAKQQRAGDNDTAASAPNTAAAAGPLYSSPFANAGQ